MNGNNHLLVESLVLKGISEDVEKSLVKVIEAFDRIEAIVRKTNAEWEGDGAEAHKKAFYQRKVYLQEMYTRFENNITSLQEMAGIYEKAEAIAKETVDAIPSDSIV